MIGVQSRKNKERDFTEGKPIHFIVGGLIGTVLFMLAGVANCSILAGDQLAGFQLA